MIVAAPDYHRYALVMKPVLNPAPCQACHHPWEGHQEVRDPAASVSGSLQLRAQCRAGRCACRCYVGLVWERVTP